MKSIEEFRNNLVDLHAHILPGVDHGSDSVETSVSLVRRARVIGIRTIVASSHYYHHTMPIEHFLSERERAWETLTARLETEELSDVRIVKAAEVALETEMLDRIQPDQFRKLCIDKTDFLLLEMPLNDLMWNDQTPEMIHEVECRFGVRPIIAHIERYNRKYTDQLVERGYLAQINADLLSDFTGRRFYKHLLSAGAIHLIGSDAHDLMQRNYDNFARAVHRLDDDVLEYFTQNAHCILNNRLPGGFCG